MKIGILTQPLQDNYGGLLQNFALQAILKQDGHDVVTYNWKKKQPFWRFYAYYIGLYLRSLVKKDHTPPFIVTDKERANISKYTSTFINSFIEVSDMITRYKDFVNYTKKNKIDALVVGSDQVWRPRYNYPFQGCMFLDFAENLNIRRIAYAASFGTDKWELSKSETEKYKRLVAKFDMVTVREDSAVKLCEDHFGISSSHVLDPTLLLEAEDYQNIVYTSEEPISEGQLFYYLLDPTDRKKTFVSELAQRMNIKPFTVMPDYTPEMRTKENVRKEIDRCVFPPVERWLRAFMDAKYVICDSFHGCVFSIIFNKPFWVISNNTRGNARFDSLLRLFHLEGRLLDISNFSEDIDLRKSIDWSEVNKILREKKSESKRILLNALN